MKKLIKVILSIFARQPDRVIGVNYLSRWHLVPRNPFFNIYLHKFTGSDDERALHDHPWRSFSIRLQGKGTEVFRWTPDRDRFYEVRRKLPRFVFRNADFAHRIIIDEGPLWTIFITGHRRRRWGFWCPKGWVHWKKFTDETGLTVGAGCGDDDDITDDEIFSDDYLPPGLRRQAD